jgi:hypothetical protein
MSSTPHKLVRLSYMGCRAEAPIADGGGTAVLTAVLSAVLGAVLTGVLTADAGWDGGDSWLRARVTARLTSTKSTCRWICRMSPKMLKPTLHRRLEKSQPDIDIQWNLGSPGSNLPIILYRSPGIGPQFTVLGLPIFRGNIAELTGNPVHQGHHNVLGPPQIDERAISWYRICCPTDWAFLKALSQG